MGANRGFGHSRTIWVRAAAEYSNSVTNAALLVVEWGGGFSYHGVGGGPPKLGSFRVVPTIGYAQRVVWAVPKASQPLSSETHIDFLFNGLLER